VTHRELKTFKYSKVQIILWGTVEYELTNSK
jgi:hypothetical protein